MRQYLVAMSLFILSLPSAAQDVIRIVGQEGDERFYPLLQSVYHAMGMEPEFTLQPSARALVSVNNGIYDAEVGRVPDISANYPNIVYSKEPLVSTQLVALVKRNSTISLGSAAELPRYRIGYLLGMSVAESYVSETGLTATAVATHEQLGRLLNQGRIDIALMGTALMNSDVFKVGKQALKLREYYVYHLFNRDSATLIDRFDDALRQAKKDGRYDRLLMSTYD